MTYPPDFIPDYLSKKNYHIRDTHITFDPVPHKYTVNGDTDYISVTTWNHSHFEKFNSDVVIDKMMNSNNWVNSKYYGKTKDEIKKMWSDNGKEASSAGTKMHFDIECFYNKLEVKNDSVEFSYFLKFHNDFQHLIPYRTEWMVYDTELKLSGSIDMIYQDKNGNLRIYDWKRSKEIKKNNKWQNSKTECIAHLPDCNFWHYSLQLNMYKAILERNYNKRVVEMCLICLHPDNSNNSYIKYEVPDLAKEIDDLIEYRLSQLI